MAAEAKVAKVFSFKLRPSTVQALQRAAIQGIYTCAGNYRTQPVQIHGTIHQPPPADKVASLAEEMCDYVNDNWKRTAIHLAAYAMWRLNWISVCAAIVVRHARAHTSSCV